MKYFTNAQIEEIRARLATRAVRDTDFDDVAELTDDDYVALVQAGVNRKVKYRDFYKAIIDMITVYEAGSLILYNEPGDSTTGGMTQASITSNLNKKLDANKYILYTNTGASTTAGMSQFGITMAIASATLEKNLLPKFTKLTDTEIEELLGLN